MDIKEKELELLPILMLSKLAESYTSDSDACIVQVNICGSTIAPKWKTQLSFELTEAAG